MKRATPFTFFLFCLMITGWGSTYVESHQRSARSTLVLQLPGTWKSESPEDIDSGYYSTREFTFTEKRWRVDAKFYKDQLLSVPLFTFSAEGPYRLDKASSVVIGARNAVFSFSKKTLTLASNDPAILSRFKLADCQLVVGVPKDISSTGCSFFTSISQCGQEFDLVDIKDDLLRLGMRPADRNMCSEDKRPKALGLPVRRQKND